MTKITKKISKEHLDQMVKNGFITKQVALKMQEDGLAAGVRVKSDRYVTDIRGRKTIAYLTFKNCPQKFWTKEMKKLADIVNEVQDNMD